MEVSSTRLSNRVRVRALGAGITGLSSWIATEPRAHALQSGPERVAVLAYHNMDETGSPYSVRPDQFAAQMAWLASEGYQAITLSQFADWAFEGTEAPERAIAVTFDDGWLSQLDTATTMDQYGLFGNYFLHNGAEVGPGDIQYLASSGGEIGGHTVNHVFLPDHAYQRQLGEIRNNAAWLEAITGHPVRFIAWPFGEANATAAQAARDAGLRGGFDGWGRAAIRNQHDPWRIPRLIMTPDLDLETFIYRVTQW